MEDIYRAILTNDHDSAEERVDDKYIQRGVCEKNFDVQNNDFGWAHLPFSTMEDNTVFMLFAAMLKNSCQYLPDKACRVFHRVDMRSRLKRFVFSFIVVPVEWGSRGKAMNTGHLHAGQVAALLVRLQHRSWMRRTFSRAGRWESFMGVRRSYVRKSA